MHFLIQFDLNIRNMLYLCNVFFMVLDLRLREIGCRETTFLFLCPSETNHSTIPKREILVSNPLIRFNDTFKPVPGKHFTQERILS